MKHAGCRRSAWRRFAVLLGIILGVALPIRLYLAFNAVMVSRDGAIFVWYARDLAVDPVGEMRQQAQHPLYPALILGMHALLDVLRPILPALPQAPAWEWQVAAVSVTLLGGLAAVAAVYFLGVTLFTPRVGLLAALLAALAVQFCRLSADALTDMPHLAAYLTAIAAGIRGVRDRRPGWLVVCGFLAGVGFLFRPEGAEPAVITSAALVLLPTMGSLRQRLVGLLVLSIPALALAAPYMLITGKLIQKKSIKQFVPITAQSPLQSPAGVLLVHPGLVSQTRSERFIPAAAATSSGLRSTDFAGAAAAQHAAIASAPPAFIVDWFQASGLILSHYFRSLRVTLALPLFVWFYFRRQLPVDRVGGIMIAAGAILHLLILHLLVLRFDYWELLSLRHLMILAGFTLPFSAAGILAVADQFPLPRRRVLTAAVVIGLIAPTLPWMLEPIEGSDLHLRRAADWIAGQSPAGAKLLTTRHRVAYYSESVYVSSPDVLGAAAVMNEARAHGAYWLVFDERRIRRMSATFFDDLYAVLLPGESLERVHVAEHHSSRGLERALVYVFHPAAPATAETP